MDTVYTTTITHEAERRGIRVRALDPELPIFELSFRKKTVRCYNGLTDRVGAATFFLAWDKRAANGILKKNGFPVPSQEKYKNMAQAKNFLRTHGTIVVKPSRQWGGRGVSVAICHGRELPGALKRAERYRTDEEEILLEQCVRGVDIRLILINYKFVAAIERTPARVVGNGKDDIRTLIRRKNEKAAVRDPSNRIPLDGETRRNLRLLGLGYSAVPAKGRKVQVRLTSNYHTGGTVREITDSVEPRLIREAEKAARLFQAPVLGIDFLVDRRTKTHHIIETSPDLAISPPEGARVARYFLDYLFPATASSLGGTKTGGCR